MRIVKLPSRQNKFGMIPASAHGPLDRQIDLLLNVRLLAAELRMAVTKSTDLKLDRLAGPFREKRGIIDPNGS
ncbi:MAG: hypothetical protein LBF34_03565 [Puniceicoccales bacterium]|nr:hypothetical protein [Puniceicoccales bacterium]